MSWSIAGSSGRSFGTTHSHLLDVQDVYPILLAYSTRKSNPATWLHVWPYLCLKAEKNTRTIKKKLTNFNLFFLQAIAVNIVNAIIDI